MDGAGATLAHCLRHDRLEGLEPSNGDENHDNPRKRFYTRPELLGGSWDDEVDQVGEQA